MVERIFAIGPFIITSSSPPPPQPFSSCHKMADNRDKNPLIMGTPHAQDFPFANRNSTRILVCCCCNVADECPSRFDKLKGSAPWPASFVNEAAASCGRRWRTFSRRLKRTNSMSMHSSNQSKSGRFQYDPLSYALNFDDGSVDEDEHSLRTFSARFACPIAKPRETEWPFI